MEFTMEELKLIETALITEELRLEEVIERNNSEKTKKKLKKLEVIFDKIEEEKKRLFLLEDIENRMEGII